MATNETVSPQVPAQEIVDKFVGVCHGKLETVKSLLLEHPGLLNAASSQQETGIQAAAHTAQKEIVLFLLEQGAPLDICTAAFLGRDDEVRQRLDADPAQKDATGAHGLPLMMFAAMGKHVELAKLLQTRGVSVNGGNGINTPLHAAIWANSPELVTWLLDQGAATDTKDFMGKTPRQAAESYKRAPLVEIFDQRGIN